MTEKIRDKCFVVMPFGKKPKLDGSGGTYDFDKVYRVIMKRAIQQAGMEAIRADETPGSRIIHTDMFKDLRDRPIVLVDLSLNNPNVFYELGIRHVMSPRGTVLMCCEGQGLPFDVKLSRTLFYKFDGESLDWEEAESVVTRLQAQLEEARRGEDDSPVHLLLDRVLTDSGDASRDSAHAGAWADTHASAARLDRYQQLVAQHWATQGLKLGELRRVARDSAFGTRALGFWALDGELTKKPTRPQLVAIAQDLYDFEQYDLANRVFERLESSSALGFEELLVYASSITEAVKDLGSAKRAIRKVEDALSVLEGQADLADDDTTVCGLAHGYNTLAGLLLWQWHLSASDDDLADAIASLRRADTFHEDARSRVAEYPLGLVALNKLKLMLTLRVQESDNGREDVEGYRQAILGLDPSAVEDPEIVSYTCWYQVITLADAGDEDGADSLAMETARIDAELQRSGKHPSIGRRQYSNLRRFLENWASWLSHPSAIGGIAKILKIFQQP